MKLKLFILFVFSYVSCITLNAQTQIKGLVSDAQTGDPLVEATIKSTLDGGTTSDTQGKFELLLPPGSTEIEVSYVGYRTQKIKVPQGKGLIVVRMLTATEQLIEVTVSAYNAKRPLLTVAAPVTTLTAKDISRGDNTALISTLNTVTGVKLDYYTYGDYRLNIRGGALAQPSVHSSGYRMYWNDIPITSASGGNPLGGLDVNFIDQMEIIKGPGSTVYGAGFGGTVLVNTQKAKEVGTSVTSDLMIGGYGTIRATNGLQAGWNNGQIAVRHTYIESDGYRDNTATDGRVFNLFGQQYFGSKGILNYLFNIENRKTGIAGDLDRETFETAPMTANTVAPTEFGPDKKTFGLSYRHKFNNQWEATLGGHYFDNDGFFKLTFPFFGIYDEEPSNGINTRATLRYKGKLNTIKLTIDGGMEFGTAKNEGINYDSDFDLPGANVFNINTANTDQWLGFAQAELLFPNDFYLTLGTSYNTYSYDVASGTNTDNPIRYKTRATKLVPRLALLKKLGTYSVYASVGEGFSPPAAGVFNDFLNADGSVNENLEAATGWNYEIGSRGTSANGLFFYDASAYLLNVRDAIISRLFEVSPGVNAERKTNAGKVRQLGLETLAGINLTRNLEAFLYGSQLRLGYTFNDYSYVDYQTVRTEFDDDFNATSVPVDYSDNQIPGTLPHTFFGTIDLTTKVGAYLNFTYNYFDSTFLTDSNVEKIESYSLINFRLGYRANLMEKRLAVHPYVGANNLGDTFYSALTAYNSTFGGFFNPGYRRQFFAGLELRYSL